MTDRDSSTPRVFILRHGETEWSKNGRFTSFTDIDLTPDGITQVSSAAKLLVGKGELIDPGRLSHIFVSPRKRAQTTLELVLPASAKPRAKEVCTTEDIAEWNYGEYEGMLKEEIQNLRKEKGLDVECEWDVWTGGCEGEGGESVQQVTERLDRLIRRIKDIQRPHMYGPDPADIVIVAHGLILRCFVHRWLGYEISNGPALMFEPGAVGILSYKDNNVEKPAIHVGVPI